MSQRGQHSGRGQARAQRRGPGPRAAGSDEFMVLRAELARLQTELATAEEQAHVAADVDRLTEEFIATASHDLKAPLATLRGYSQLLLRRLQQPQPDLALLARGLAQSDAQAHAMARLQDDLLDASRLQTGHFRLRTAPCDLGECLDSVLARLDPGARERVRVELPDAPVAGDWEGARIQQVLANLIGNALKYSPPATTVRVRVEWREGAGHGATFQFTLPRHASAAAPGQAADAERKESTG